MALRDSLRTNTQPLLEPDEQIEQIFPARAGINPWIPSMFGPIGLPLMIKWIKFPIIAVTDHSLVILDAGLSGTKPKSILKRLPRDTPLGPLKGIWAVTVIDGEKMWIHKTFHKDANAAASI